MLEIFRPLGSNAPLILAGPAVPKTEVPLRTTSHRNPSARRQLSIVLNRAHLLQVEAPLLIPITIVVILIIER